MRRLAGVGVESVELGGFDGFGQAPDDRLELGEGASLIEDDGVEFLVGALQVGQLTLDTRESLVEVFAHGDGRQVM